MRNLRDLGTMVAITEGKVRKIFRYNIFKKSVDNERVKFQKNWMLKNFELF
jgi:hypothetical protein